MGKKQENKIIRSRVQMLISFPFFGQLALYLEIVEMKGIGTAATDGKNYYYEPDFIDKLDEKEMNFVTVHEVLHPALGHLWRRGTRDKTIWNIAADYVINGMIKEVDPDGTKFKLLPNIYYDPKYNGMSTEQVYDILIADKNFCKKAKEMHSNDGVFDNHDMWGKGYGAGQSDEEDWQSRVVSAAQVAAGKGKGKTPALIERMIGNLTHPQKDWKELLAEFIEQEITDYGFTPPDRRFVWNDIILPDFSEMDDVIKWLVFAVDTSGSIDEETFRIFISEVVGCLNQFGGKVKGKLIYCDASIHPEGIYELEDAAHSIPRGFGGTDFRPVFDWIEKNLDECSGLVYLTDGMGTYPEEAPNYPVLWALTEPYNVPFGNKTDIKIGKSYV